MHKLYTYCTLPFFPLFLFGPLAPGLSRPLLWPRAHGGGGWFHGLFCVGEMQGCCVGLEVEEEMDSSDSAGLSVQVANLARPQVCHEWGALVALAAMGEGTGVPARQA